MRSDPAPSPRIKDPGLMRLMHADPRKECALTGETFGLELHHIVPKGAQRGDDVRANLAFLSGEKHRLITANGEPTCREFGQYLFRDRPDTIAYVTMKMGGFEQAAAWLRRRYYIGA